MNFRYFIQRIWLSLPTLFGISLLCFFLIQLTPGGPVEMELARMRQMSNGGEAGGGSRVSQVTEEQKQALIAYYGFDKPIHIRYLKWMGNILTLNFGESYQNDRKVLELIQETMPVSISLGLFSFLLIHLISIPLGIGKAIREGTSFDMVSSLIIFFLYSLPSFAFGICLIVFFGGGSYYNIFPIQGLVSDSFSDLSVWGKVYDYFMHLFLPLSCYTVGGFAALTILMKNSFLETLKQDYIRTARAKGLPEKKIFFRHALKNALLPIANHLGQFFTIFFSGSLLIETIFGLQGMGRLSYESIVQRDYPVVLAIILILSVLQIFGNLLSDLIYAILDPRIQFE